MNKVTIQALVLSFGLALCSEGYGMFVDRTFEQPMVGQVEEAQVVPGKNVCLRDCIRRSTEEFLWEHATLPYTLYRRYIRLPLKQMEKMRQFKAPAHVQAECLALAKDQCRPGKLIDLLKYEYKRRFGFLTVYELPEINASIGGCVYPCGGVYVPKKRFSMAQLSPSNMFTLGHEVSHVMHGDVTGYLTKNKVLGLEELEVEKRLANIDPAEASKRFRLVIEDKERYKFEFFAQKSAIEVFYKRRNFDAIVAGATNLCGVEGWLGRQIFKFLKWCVFKIGFTEPYSTGFVDTLSYLCRRNHYDKELLSCAASIGVTPYGDTIQTWQERQEQAVAARQRSVSLS